MTDRIEGLAWGSPFDAAPQKVLLANGQFRVRAEAEDSAFVEAARCDGCATGHDAGRCSVLGDLGFKLGETVEVRQVRILSRCEQRALVVVDRQPLAIDAKKLPALRREADLDGPEPERHWLQINDLRFVESPDWRLPPGPEPT